MRNVGEGQVGARDASRIGERHADAVAGDGAQLGHEADEVVVAQQFGEALDDFGGGVPVGVPLGMGLLHDFRECLVDTAQQML